MIFDIALWRSWPLLFPEYCASIEAATAFAAVELLMRRSHLLYAARVSARAVDGSLIYPGSGVEVVVPVRDWRQAEEEVDADG